MAFVNKSGGDGEETSTDVAAGGPPQWDIDFDPNDPDQVKVHYDLAGWNFEQRAELAETLAENNVPHMWDGDELVVPEQLETHVDGLFEQLEAELGPFPVVLGDDEPATEFGLDEWEKDGQKMSKLGVVAERVQFLSSPRKASMSDGPGEYRGGGDNPPGRSSGPTGDEFSGDDEIPF